MIVTLHMCMPEGDAMRSRFGNLMEAMKLDNRAVIAAMLADGIDVPDTVGELGLRYEPAQHRLDAFGQPVMDLYGIHDMVDREAFSCGDAAAFEAAILEEKYGVPTICIAVAQGDTDLHGLYVTLDGAVDPTANFLRGARSSVPSVDEPLAGSACIIEDGRVVCHEEAVCSVDERGRWDCAPVPGLTGRRERIGRVHETNNGQAWARTDNGAVVPVRRRR